jgi:hypothetical protein
MSSSPDLPNREEVNVATGEEVPPLLRVFAALSSGGLELIRTARAVHADNAVWVYVPGVLAVEFPDAEPVLIEKVLMLEEFGAARSKV